ncbi:tetratricopeptide repeat protein [Candidatus Woesearchaeota archaeon]|nr:tetratricopeptide repeat protein [Candidatus Woesearchaeota archaeon]
MAVESLDEALNSNPFNLQAEPSLPQKGHGYFPLAALLPLTALVTLFSFGSGYAESGPVTFRGRDGGTYTRMPDGSLILPGNRRVSTSVLRQDAGISVESAGGQLIMLIGPPGGQFAANNSPDAVLASVALNLSTYGITEKDVENQTEGYYLGKARALQDAGKLDLAAEILEQGLTKHEKSGRMYEMAGDVAEKQYRRLEAISYFKKAIPLVEKKEMIADLWFRVGENCFIEGYKKSSRFAFEKARELGSERAGVILEKNNFENGLD